MSVEVTFSCDGCDVAITGTSSLDRTFKGFNGKSWGFGRYHLDEPQDLAPEGWVAHDPYTGCCYCPDCWSKIEDKD